MMKFAKLFVGIVCLSSTVVVAASAQAAGLTGSGALRVLGKCVDVPNWNVTNGTKVSLYNCNGGSNQDWVFRSDGTIRPMFNSKKCLDLYNGQATDGTAIQIYDCNGGTNQQWTLGTDGTIKGKGSMCVDDPNGNTADGTNLLYYHCNGGTNQAFTLAAVGIGSLHMLGKCLDLPYGDTTNGKTLQVYDCNGGDNQEWVLAYDGTVRSMKDRNKCLDLQNGQTGNGTAIVINDWTGSASQQWVLGADGTLRGMGNKCADLPYGDTSKSFQYFDCNGGTNQKFTLNTVPVELDGQEQSNWCWAATTQMIAAYFGVSRTQCTIANKYFGFPLLGIDCCNPSYASTTCNQGGWWNLTSFGFTETDSNKALPFDQLSAEFASSRPVAFAWKYKDGKSGHALVATGTWTSSSSGQQWVSLSDPEPQGVGSTRDVKYSEWANGPSNYTFWKVSYNITKK
jgi:hypothetical protein